ncbi:MAG: hypothetical protein KGV59_05470 [Tenacibaculum sp.]|nr:hypothetical protein [Tenacibaculum sp.]
MPQPLQHKELINLLLRQEWYMQRLYANLSNDLASILRRYKVKGKKNIWQGNVEVKKELNALIKRYEKIYFNHISEQIKQGLELSHKHSDNLVNNYIKGLNVPEKQKKKYFKRNNEALNNFINRSHNGYTLSDRVWNITKQNREHIDNFIKAGLTEGRSASKLSRDIREYLKEPNKRFRRVRDENGKLVLSNPAKNYKSGQGVYRSSYKNALRLARNEVNIAYRTADHERRKNMNFVLGVVVKTSGAHKGKCICDELAGEYPKDFKFTGWHPQCLCYTTSKLMDTKDFVKYLKGEKQPTGHTKNIPKRAEKFIKLHSDKLKSYKAKPLYISDNFKYVKDEGYVYKRVKNEIREKIEYKEINFKSKGQLLIPEKFNQNPQEEKKNIKAYTFLAKEYGVKYRLLNIVNEDGVKNPDAINLKTKKYSDAKIPTSKIGKNAIQNSIKSASDQKIVKEVYIYLEHDYPMLEIWKGLRVALLGNRAKTIKQIIIRLNNGVIKNYNVKKLKKVFNKKIKRKNK